jgi:hypothetical protein
MQPPNEKVLFVVAGVSAALAVLWFAAARRRFPGPPHGVLEASDRRAIRAAEAAVHEASAGETDGRE